MAEKMIVGLYSPAPQSGKSTVAGHLVRTYGFTRKGFADGLRSMANTLLLSLGFTQEQADFYLTTGEGKETVLPELGGRTPRYAMQTLGTEWGRQLLGPDFWVTAVLNDRRPDMLVIDDVRFPNEYAAIRREGGEVWKVVRPGAGPTNGHPSEGLLDPLEFDEVIVNDGSVEVLIRKTEWALRGPF